MNAHKESRSLKSPASKIPSLFSITALIALAAGCAAYDALGQETSSGTKPVARPVFDNRNSVDWHEHISSPDTELAWEQIPWRPSFLTGLREAAAAEKPVLLWVMNGHPLGCT